MRIAVDVMGGDHGCGVVITGAKLALEANKKITDKAEPKPSAWAELNKLKL